MWNNDLPSPIKQLWLLKGKKALSEFSVKEIQAELKANQSLVSGTKSVVINRLHQVYKMQESLKQWKPIHTRMCDLPISPTIVQQLSPEIVPSKPISQSFLPITPKKRRLDEEDNLRALKKMKISSLCTILLRNN